MQIRHDHNLTLTVSAKLLQAMSVLQMTSQELTEHILQQLQENPALDIEASDGLLRFIYGEDLSRREPQGQRQYEDDSDRPEPAAQEPEGETLADHLLSQLSDAGLDAEHKQLCEFLIRCVDDRGYLTENPDEIAQLLGTEPLMVEHCFKTLRSLTPVGVCAENLCACLLAQLDGERDALAGKIIATQLNALSKGHYSDIARALRVSLSEVYAAERRIKKLEPIPARGFATGEKAQYLYPDAVVTLKSGEPEVELSRSFLPYLCVSPFYSELLRSTDDEIVREYLSRSISSASALIRNVSQREQTMLECMKVIVEIQRSVFTEGSEPVPMSIMSVAARMGVNKSTVSRAVRGKYIQCSSGVIPVKELFSNQLVAAGECGGTSQADARSAVARLIKEENSTAPLSDERICALLAQEGISISRRTVAKYRQSLKIASSYIRASKKSSGC